MSALHCEKYSVSSCSYGIHDNFNVYFRVNVLRLWYCLLRATELLDEEQFERLKTSAINVMWR